MAGYSGTPLLKKLGLKEGDNLYLFNEPKEYLHWISPLPKEVQVKQRPSKNSIQFAHVFVLDKKTFQPQFLKVRDCLTKTGLLWISWPKKTSKIATDLDENIIRDFGLKNGLVDVKVCAVSEVWSGLKFVYRVKDR